MSVTASCFEGMPSDGVILGSPKAFGRWAYLEGISHRVQAIGSVPSLPTSRHALCFLAHCDMKRLCHLLCQHDLSYSIGSCPT